MKNYNLLIKGFAVIILSLILFNCSAQKDEQLLENAKNNLKEAKYIEAVSDFETLLNEFPESEYNVEATYELAKLYHGKVLKTISVENSLKKAVQLYQKVFELAPESNMAENALFMSGFVLANELEDFDQAKAVYQLFIKAFPKSELAASAKEEINNLGIPPEEILKSKAVVPTK